MTRLATMYHPRRPADIHTEPYEALRLQECSEGAGRPYRASEGRGTAPNGRRT